MLSSTKLDNLRIDNFLKPWLDKKRSHYSFLSPNATAVVIDAAKKGLDFDVLKEKLLKLSGDGSQEKKISHFIKKYGKKIDKFQKKSIKIEARPEQRPRQPSPQDSNRQNDNRFRQQTDNRNNYQKSKSPFQNQRQYQAPQQRQNRYSLLASGQSFQKIEKPPPAEEQPPKPVLPSYFLDSSSFSLRHVDQKVKPLLFNEEGKRIDEEGNVIKTEFVRRTNVIDPKSKSKEKEIIDRRIPTVIRPANREFKFINPGSISSKVEEKRKEAEVDLSVASGCNIFDTIALSRNYEKPEIDWWDRPFVHIDEETGEWSPNYEYVSNEYENATLIPSPQLKEVPVPTFQTAKERKRLKHIAKIERQKEQRLMERLNLVPREPQRIKQNQMINFNQGKAVLAPTEVEMQAKAAREYRIQKHEENNAKAKLTPEQRSAKNDEKRKMDFENNDVNITVFIVDNSISLPLNSDKVTKMASKWFMKGGVFKIKAPPMNFVLTEGGPKATRKFSALMLNRINWDSWKAKIVFQGVIAGKPHFYNFKSYLFNIRTECRRFMEKYRAEEFFDAATREYPETPGAGLEENADDQQNNQNDN